MVLVGWGYVGVLDVEVLVVHCLHDALPLGGEVLMTSCGMHGGVKHDNGGGRGVDVHYHVLTWVGNAEYKEVTGVVLRKPEMHEMESKMLSLCRQGW